MNRVRVLIADDQPLLREGLQSLLAGYPDVEVVGTAVDGEEAVAQTASLQPDVVLMDVRMPRMDGVQATREIRQRFPRTGILILTTFPDDEYVFPALRAGADGYLLKDIPPEELVAGILSVTRGGSPVAPVVARKMISALTQPQPEPLPKGLFTEREREVLCLAAHGLSNREIASRLFLTEGTVKNHLSSVFAKLQVRDRTQAVLWAHARGLCGSRETGSG